MTPKEKAKELFDKFYDKIEDIEVKCGMYCQGGTIDIKQPSKQCALIAVDEIIANGFNPQLPYNFWNDVKQELEKL